MVIIKKEGTFIEEVLSKNIADPNVYFVFSTDVALKSWIEWCVKHPERTGVKAVAIDRFIAWDKFKEHYVITEQKGKQAIPSILRKVFVYDLIAQNAALVSQNKEPLFKSIINPLYASQSYSFVDWISSNLPSLKNWYDRFTSYCQRTGAVPDDEDQDYITLYEKYSKFLGANMFEPAWETPSFEEESKRFILFYPEQLEDFEDYKEILQSVNCITAYMLSDEKNHPEVIKYSDSRKELRRTVLKIRNLINTSNGDIKYNDVALIVPNIAFIKPYIQRELEKYCIPYVIRTGDNIISNTAASIFNDFTECIDSNFSYDSVRSLLLNDYIPWKEKDLNLSLIKEGQRLHIVCNKGDDAINDEWIRTLKLLPQCERELRFYKKLKGSIKAIYNAKTFAEIKISWFTFKNDFLTDDEFSENANNILGQCISELESLISIEDDFIKPLNLVVSSPYRFYLSVLQKKSYRPQEEITGLNVFDYKLTACSAYKYNFIINASQKNLTVPYRPLSFINNKKRAALGIHDSDNASAAFIELYNKYNNNGGVTVFSYGENSFDGFSIPHNYLIEKQEQGEEYLDKEDFVLSEKKAFINRSFDNNTFSIKQQKQFQEWKSKSYSVTSSIKDSYSVSNQLRQKINEVLVDNRCNNSSDKSTKRITQSDMNAFFPCQRYWLLQNVLKLSSDDLESDLVNRYDAGNINHKALELLFAQLNKLPITQQDNTFGQDEEIIKELITKSVYNSIHDASMNFANSPLVIEMLEGFSIIFESILYGFLREFCRFDENGERFGGYEVYATEKKLEILSENSSFMYSGRIDCLLKNTEGEIIIVDYKNTLSKSIKDYYINEDTGDLSDYQCAMYVKMFNLNNPDNISEHMVFQSITNPQKYNFIIGDSKGKRTLEAYQPTLDLFTKKAMLFSDMIDKANLKPVKKNGFNSVDTYNNCSNCSYKTVCRTCYTVAGHNL